MPIDAATGRLLGTQGWRQLLTCKKELLDAFDRARQHSRAHEIETYHGIVAEAQFRNWLTDFLPKKYGVTAGYIVSQGASENDKLPAFVVIIFDQLEAPILWVESHPDVSPLGKMRAIPAEYVKAVIEVKAVWNSATATKAVSHLADLTPLLAGLDPPAERYKKFLPWNFTSWIVFLISIRASIGALLHSTTYCRVICSVGIAEELCYEGKALRRRQLENWRGAVSQTLPTLERSRRMAIN
jgi:hypothetical protein